MDTIISELSGRHTPKQSGMQRKEAPADSFLGAVAQEAAKSRTSIPAGGLTGLAGMTSWAALQAAGVEAVNRTQAAEPVSLETMLKEKYPNIRYHVFDASSSYWRARTDYPHYLLYQEGDEAKETLENWKPEGPNPFYGSIDGKFIAPKEIHALGSVPPGSKAVVIHPKVQERMEQDPAYAKEIYERIDTWFTFDVARNEAIMPGSTWDMAQAVAIGEDGNICNACASSPGGFTYSKSGSDDEESWWELRMARHTELMEQVVKKQIKDKLLASDLAAAAAAKSRLAAMLSSGNLQKIFGDEIAGVPTETVLAITQSQVWGDGSILR